MTSSVWWKSREFTAPLWSRKNRPGAMDLMAFSSRSTIVAGRSIDTEHSAEIHAPMTGVRGGDERRIA